MNTILLALIAGLLFVILWNDSIKIEEDVYIPKILLMTFFLFIFAVIAASVFFGVAYGLQSLVSF